MLVRGGVCLLVVGVDVLLGVLALLVVGVVLPVAVLHHLALSQVRRTLHKLRKPAAEQQMYTKNAKSFSESIWTLTMYLERISTLTMFDVQNFFTPSKVFSCVGGSF